MPTETLPLFPLNMVLFPHSVLALRVFEPRYLALVSACMKGDHGFGVCLIHDGAEVGEAASPHLIGTRAHITDWYQHPDGVLGITVQGDARFHILSMQTRPDQLLTARVELLPADAACAIPPDYSTLITLLQQAMGRAHSTYAGLPEHYGDAAWVSYRLAELLPFSLEQKQELLEINDPMQRLAHIHGTLGKQLVQ